jgi:3-keto-5-aminohexanoate cleavage enzyme
MTSEELAVDARACMHAGATAVHLHVRDGQGKHTLDAQIYRQAIESVRKATDGNMIIQMTTEACGVYAPEQQMAAVRELRPEAASVAVREIVQDDAGIPAAAEFFAWARERCIGLQYVVYDQADLHRALFLQQEGIIPDEQPHLLLVLGRYGADQTSNPADLLPFLSLVPRDWPWSVCAFGASEADCMRAAIESGGNCRVGFENNCLLPNGGTASSNADLIANIANTVKSSSRAVGSIHDARALYIG